jgi:hypothetical protein
VKWLYLAKAGEAAAGGLEVGGETLGGEVIVFPPPLVGDRVDGAQPRVD